MYYIYHIPGVKIGCTSNPNRRLRAQCYSNYKILEEHSDIYIASDRELALQKQYGYKIDKIPYLEVIKLHTLQTPEGKRKGGLVTGKKNKESGYLQSISSKAGKITGSIQRTCPHCNKVIKGGVYFYWHGDNCKAKPQ